MFGNEWKKYYNVTIHCVRCTSSPESLCVQIVFVFGFFVCVCVFLFFLFDLESRKMAVELSFGSSVRVLKLDGCTNKSVSVSYLCLSILSWHTVRCAAIPP